jgi:hypothetical protein
MVKTLVLAAGLAFGVAEGAGAPDHGVIIEANIDSAVVVIDGAVVGVTPVRVDSLTPGSHQIAILDPDIAAWPGESIHDSIAVRQDTLVTYGYELRKRYFVTSDPGGASVFFNDSLMGTTPLLLPYINQSSLGLIHIRKEGFEEIRPVHQGSGILTARFREQWQPESSTEFPLLVSEQSGFPLILAGAATVLSGTAAAYLKIKADNRYQQFLATNNPDLLDQTHSIDRGAAVAIVVTQLSIVFFVYFLLKE